MAGESPRTIVLVDDEEMLVWSLANRLARARPTWVVDTAINGEAALERIRSKPVDLLVADVRMPGMSGIDLILAARERHPSLPVVVMTAFQTPDIQRIASSPRTDFLEKPFEFERLLELVDEALAPEPVGFSGAISVRTLPDVVQLYVLANATGMLIVKHGGSEGRLYFDRGTIPHAVTASARAEEAFYEIMMWSGGEFQMRAGVAAPEHSIRADWQGLLMESCRRLDEHTRARPRDANAGERRAGWKQTAPPPPSHDVDALFDEFDVGAGHALSQPSQPEKPTSSGQAPENKMNIKDSLSKLNQIDGFIGAALVDSESGMLLGSEGGGSINLEVAAAGNTEVVRAKRKTMNNLALKDGIEDILITLGKAYHIIRPLRSRSTLFFYVALDRQRANLAMARIALADVEKELQV